MRLSLIGMSGSGKSYWAMKLAERGFRRFCCDHLIAERLVAELAMPDGTIIGMGEWMGFPYEAQYKARESRYLSCEMEVLAEIIEYLGGAENIPEEDVVVDTTGSVIYTGGSIIKDLRRFTTMVHLETPAEIQERMLKAYVENRRPVLWRDFFTREPNETNEEALVRCFPRLLSSRERLYRRYADVTIEYDSLTAEGFGPSDFLNRVYGSLSP